MSRSSVYCEECGARLTLYVVGVCPRCEYDLTGRDEAREEREAIDRALNDESDVERTKRW